jgi:ubiquinol-cytochrome c reductase cytochrome c subunit
MHMVRSRVWLAAIAAGLVVGVVSAASAEKGQAMAKDKGKALFVKHGCWQCHGFLGQGGVASQGKQIAPDPLPLEAFRNFVRTTNRAMPPYSEAVLSDADIDEIHAYLASIPKPPDPKSIPILNQ